MGKLIDSENNSTVCAAFWHHAVVRPDNNVYVCCRYKAPVASFKNNLATVVHSSEYKKLRSNSLLGVPNPNCSKCYYEEKLGRKSVRQYYNEQWDHNTVNLQYVELSLNNICNLTCIGCNETFSNSWGEKLHPTAVKKTLIQSCTDVKEIPNSVRIIKFLGGEPLMTSKHLDVLTHVIHKSNVELVYNTNGTFLLSDRVIAEFSKFKNVRFILSLDGVDKLNDTVRPGSSWSLIINFINQVKSLGYDLTVNTVLHKENWFGIVDLSKFLEEQGIIWQVSLLTYPKNLDIINLSNQDKIKLDQLLENVNITATNLTYTTESIRNHIQGNM